MVDRSVHRRLSSSNAFILLLSMIVSLLASSSAPTPLYAYYQRLWGFSAITTTVVFALYAVAVLAALLIFGRLSDHVGRRPVLLSAVAVQILAMIVFLLADGVLALGIARVLQGLSTGAAVGALGAALIDIDSERGPTVNVLAPGFGTASGALVSGFVVQFLPAPDRLIYVLLLTVFVVQFVGALFMPETVSAQAGAWRSLRPQLSIPPAVRQPLAITLPVLFVAWSLVGLYGALAPTILTRMTGSSSPIQGGLGLFVLAMVAVVTVLRVRDAPVRSVLYGGVGALAVGASLSALAVDLGALGLFFLGTAIAGSGFGCSFHGGMRLVLPLVHTHQRSGVLSVLYLMSYLGMGVPAVIAGVLVVRGGGLVATVNEYAVAVVVLALFATAALVMTRHRSASALEFTDRAEVSGEDISKRAAAVCGE